MTNVNVKVLNKSPILDVMLSPWLLQMTHGRGPVVGLNVMLVPSQIFGQIIQKSCENYLFEQQTVCIVVCGAEKIYIMPTKSKKKI